MSRCGSCDLYWPSEDKDNFGVTCRGDCGVEECADKLQDLVLNLRVELARVKRDRDHNDGQKS